MNITNFKFSEEWPIHFEKHPGTIAFKIVVGCILTDVHRLRDLMLTHLDLAK